MTLRKFSTAFVILVAVNTTSEYGNWNPQRRPKLMGDRIPMISINPVQARVQRNIVLYHNFFRSNVRPSARNMLRMKWHKGAAAAAQRWADACVLLTHDNVTGRHIDFYGPCGQNIFIASHKVPWFFAVQTWWLEKNQFTYGRPNNITIIGHYTQMVWAASHEVGCGIAKCYHYGNYKHTKAKLYYNYVCNYCPM
nr:cysteine-rich secretory protein 2-like isoform X1 [Leptinotarsa decemlineata]